MDRCSLIFTYTVKLSMRLLNNFSRWQKADDFVIDKHMFKGPIVKDLSKVNVRSIK